MFLRRRRCCDAGEEEGGGHEVEEKEGIGRTEEVKTEEGKAFSNVVLAFHVRHMTLCRRRSIKMLFLLIKRLVKSKTHLVLNAWSHGGSG